MNTTIWVAIITAISTLLPSIVDKILEYKKGIKNTKIEFYEKNKRQALIDFIECVSSFMNDETSDLSNEMISQYYKKAYTLVAYFPNLNQETINKLAEHLDDYGENIAPYLSKIIMDVSKQDV